MSVPMPKDDGTSKRPRPGKLLAATHGAVIIAGAVVLHVNDLPLAVSITAQVASVFSGIWLGVIFTNWNVDSRTRSHARPAIRQLLDQATRLGSSVMSAEQKARLIADDDAVSPLRIADWLEDLGGSLRHEIASSVSGAENWVDLAPDVGREEMKRHKSRGHEENPDE